MTTDGGLRSIPVVKGKYPDENSIKKQEGSQRAGYYKQEYLNGIIEEYRRNETTGESIWRFDYDGDGSWDTEVKGSGGLRNNKTIVHNNDLHKQHTSIWQNYQSWQ